MKEKNFGSKGKYFIFYENIGKIIKFLTLAKMSQNIFAYFSVSEHSASFLRPGGSPPPLPFKDRSSKNSFFTPSLIQTG